MNASAPSSWRVRLRAWWTDASANPLFRMGLAGALIIAMLDRATKHWIVEIIDLPTRGKIEISGIFDLTFVQNFGASFGMLAGGMASRVFLSVVVSSVVIGLVIWLGRLRRPVAVIGVACVIGGALGNLYDRVSYGYVIDFLDFSGLYFPWVFNLADSAINIGVAFLLFDAWQTRERKPAA